MIRSMTGYGRSEVGDAAMRFTVEVRSLNNRYLDVQVKSPRSLMVLESRVKKIVQERFSRGRFDILIVRSGEAERMVQVSLNEPLARQYIAILRGIKEREGLSGDMDVSTVAALPDIITRIDPSEDVEEQWNVLGKGIEAALGELDRMRAEEGTALAKDIEDRIRSIEALQSKINTAVPATVEATRRRMSENLTRLLAEQPDPARLAQEIAIIAERTDVTEELTRLGIHLRKFRALMGDASRDGVGRKLDFLIQEIGREANTIASKSLNADIAHDVVNIKAELERIREQVQNIE